MKKILLLLLICGTLLLLYPLSQRIAVEKANNDVLIVMEDFALIALADKLTIPMTEVLTNYQNLNINHIALNPLTPRVMINRGMMVGLALFNRLILTPYDFNESLEGISRGFYLYFSDDSYRDFLLTNLSQDFTVQYIDNNNLAAGLILFPAADFNFLAAPLDYYFLDLTVFLTEEMQVLIRTSPDFLIKHPAGEIRELTTKSEVIIFFGNKVYVDEADFNNTLAYFKDNDLIFGFIEPFLAQQKGARELGLSLGENVARVHSVQQAEIDKLGADKLIARLMRAIKERNARIIYLRPFLKDDTSDLLAYNLAFIENLKQELQDAGFQLGNPGTFEPLKLSSFVVFGGGILLLTIILLLLIEVEKIIAFKLPLVLLTLFGFSIVVLLFWLLPLTLFGQALLLGVTILIPPLAVIWGRQLIRAGFCKALAVIIGVTMLGAIILGALGSETSYLLGLEQFRGVKLALLAPLLLLTLYLAQVNQLGLLLKNKRVLIATLALILFSAVALFIYITRSGNFPAIPVPAFELVLRDYLEKIFGIRPRFKEFIWGHPLLILGLWLRQRKILTPFSDLFLIWGSMGIITILNSFSHFHTPFLISLYRTGVGLLLGGMIGLGLVLVCGNVFLRRARS